MYAKVYGTASAIKNFHPNTVEPRFFELPGDQQSSSKNRGFEKLRYSLTPIFQTPTK